MTVPLILPEHVAWYARNVAGRDLTDPEARCVDVICAFRKIHEWPVHHSGKPAVALLPLDGGVTGLWRGELASWDESSLTRAVPPLDEIVAALDAPHIVTLTPTGYGLAHPLACRPNLTDCPVERACAQWAAPPALPGRYEITWDGAWLQLGAQDPDPGPDWDATVRALVAEVAHLRACLDDRNTSGRDHITRIGKL